MNSKLALIIVAALAAACSGGAQTSTTRPGGSSPASTSSSASPAPAAQQTPSVVQPGESIEREQILAAFAALEGQSSWTFTGTYWTKGSTENFEQTVAGTERRNPQVAVDAVHKQPSGDDFRYVRIGDDIWTDVGTGEFFQAEASTSDNLIDQYEPYYAAALVDDAAGGGSLEFDPVAVEAVNGTATMHYTLSENDRENAVQFLDIDPSEFAGDVWIATETGHLVALAWGPQSKDAAGPTMGFRYDVTSINCACPVEAPEVSE